MSKRYETFYCHDATCPGVGGFEVGWNPADMTDPGEWDSDTCPYCGDYMYENEIEVASLIEGVNYGLGLSMSVKEISDEGFNQLAQVILKELKRQGVQFYE